MQLFHVISFFFLLLNGVESAAYNAFVNSTSVFKIDDRFVSVTLDASQVNQGAHGWGGLNFTYATPLAKALGPMYFRYGGTEADYTTFIAADSSFKSVKDAYQNFTSKKGSNL